MTRDQCKMLIANNCKKNWLQVKKNIKNLGNIKCCKESRSSLWKSILEKNSSIFTTDKMRLRIDENSFSSYRFRSGRESRLAGYLKSVVSGNNPSIYFNCASNGSFDIAEENILEIRKLFRKKKSVKIGFGFEHSFNTKYLEFLEPSNIRLISITQKRQFRSDIRNQMFTLRQENKKKKSHKDVIMNKENFNQIKPYLKQPKFINFSFITKFINFDFINCLSSFIENNKLDKTTIKSFLFFVTTLLVLKVLNNLTQ